MLKKTDYNTRIAVIDTKLSNLDGKITKNKNELTKNTNNIILSFIGNIIFDGGDGSQSYLIFQPVYRCFKTVTNTNYISSWKSKGLSDESIKLPTTSDNSPIPALSYYDYNIKVKFTGSCLKQSKLHILIKSSSHSNYPTLKNCLFGVVTLTKNAVIDKYGYLGYGIGFDRRSSFSFLGGGFGQNVLIFGADMRSSAHIDNKKRYIGSWKRTNRRIKTYFN